MWKILLSCVLLVCAATVSAAEEKVRQMEEMVVTASRIEEKREDVTTNISIVTEEEIRNSSAQDLADLMSDQGFMIREYPNSLISVGVRGFTSDTLGNDLAGHVLILVNGRRAGTGNLAKIMLDNVARVEIIRGPGSVQYGSSAMGGVINVITKQGKGKPSVSVEQTFGSWNYLKSGATVSAETDRFDFFVSGSLESQDDYSTADSDTYYNTGFESKQRVSVNAGWTFAPKNRVGIMYSNYDAEEIGSPSYMSQNDLDDYTENSLSSFDITYSGQTAEGNMLWDLHYFKGKDEYANYDPTYYGQSPSFTRESDQQGVQAQFTYSWDGSHITAGMDWTYYEIQDTYSTGDNKYENPAAFVLAKINLLDEKLVLSAGGRYDKYDVEDDEGNSTDDTNWSTSLGLSYQLLEGIGVRMNYAEAFRMPTANELYMYDDYSAWGFGIWSGNPNLNPEKSKTYEVGVDCRQNGFSTNMTYFYSEFDDYIKSGIETSPGIYSYENVDGATISGIEGALRVYFSEVFNWNCELVPYITFTYLTEYTDEENDIDLSYTPEWTASYGLEFSNSDLGLIARLDLTYIDEQDITDYEGTGDTTLSSHTLANITVSKELYSFQRFGRVALKASISNLFNRDYEVVQGYPAPGRTFFAGLKYAY